MRAQRRVCWEALVPAGIWLLAADWAIAIAKFAVRSKAVPSPTIFMILRAGGRMSRWGFRSWRFWNRKWR